MLLGGGDGKARNKVAAKVAEECTKAGGQWFHWSQKAFIGQSTLAAKGICGGLTPMWLRHVAGGGDTPWGDYMATPDAREEAMQLKINQGKKSQTYVEDHLKTVGLKKAFDKSGETDTEISKLIAINGFYDITISNVEGEFADDTEMLAWIEKNSKSHALAAATDKAGSMFFDPNYGSGLFPKAEQLTVFFAKFWKNVYKNFKGTTNLTRYAKK
jgi:Yersinia/Haemophilus virulence surface antigen